MTGREGRAVARSAAPSPDGAGGPRVLLVEDEGGLAGTVARFLTLRGYEVCSAPSGREALSAVRSTAFDAIVCDLGLPDTSGEHLYTTMVNAYPALAGRFLFTSGDLGDDRTREFIGATGCGSLAKPFTLDELAHKLQGVIPDGLPAGRHLQE